jgi:hypothetical protein
MLKIELNTSRVEARLAKMLDGIKQFGSEDMSAELMAWQVDDVHRRFPHVEQTDQQTVETSIQTHSHVMAVAQSSRTPRPPRPTVVHRPVVRPQLIDRLRERMVAKAQEKITWR